MEKLPVKEIENLELLSKEEQVNPFEPKIKPRERKKPPPITVVSFLNCMILSFFTTVNYQVSMLYIRVLISANYPVYYSKSIGYATGFYGVVYTAIVLGARFTLQIYTG